MTRKPTLPRTAHTIIEPGPFEKDIINKLMAYVRGIVANKEQLGFNIQQFAEQVGLDFFTPLLTSPHESVRLIGLTQRDIATNLGAQIVNRFHVSLAAYVNELDMKPIDRKRIVVEYMLTQGNSHKL